MDKDYIRLLDIYPDLLECHFVGKEFLGLKFKNPFIYKAMGHSLLRIINRGLLMVWLETKGFDSLSDRVRMSLNTTCQSGHFAMVVDMNLPDEVCVFLYNMGIDIYTKEDDHWIPYDKNLIMRRHTIQNIINE